MGYKAELIRGDNYFLGKKRFTKGEPKAITDAEKELLENAVERFTVDKEEFVKPKFKITEVADEAGSEEAGKSDENPDDKTTAKTAASRKRSGANKD